MTTAAVYALGVPCLSIEERILTDTARMAQDLAPILSKGPSAKIFHRTFWVIYAIEKTSSFHFGRSSVSPLVLFTEIYTNCPRPSMTPTSWYLYLMYQSPTLEVSTGF